MKELLNLDVDSMSNEQAMDRFIFFFSAARAVPNTSLATLSQGDHDVLTYSTKSVMP